MRFHAKLSIVTFKRCGAGDFGELYPRFSIHKHDRECAISAQ